MKTLCLTFSCIPISFDVSYAFPLSCASHIFKQIKGPCLLIYMCSGQDRCVFVLCLWESVRCVSVCVRVCMCMCCPGSSCCRVLSCVLLRLSCCHRNTLVAKLLLLLLLLLSRYIISSPLLVQYLRSYVPSPSSHICHLQSIAGIAARYWMTSEVEWNLRDLEGPGCAPLKLI